MSLQEIGDLLRAMAPGMAAHPIASLVETTQQDVPDVADMVPADDGSLTFIPDGDARDCCGTWPTRRRWRSSGKPSQSGCTAGS